MTIQVWLIPFFKIVILVSVLVFAMMILATTVKTYRLRKQIVAAEKLWFERRQKAHQRSQREIEKIVHESESGEHELMTSIR